MEGVKKNTHTKKTRDPNTNSFHVVSCSDDSPWGNQKQLSVTQTRQGQALTNRTLTNRTVKEKLWDCEWRCRYSFNKTNTGQVVTRRHSLTKEPKLRGRKIIKTTLRFEFLKKDCRKGSQSSLSNFSVSHLHSLSPANPVMCVSPIQRLQQNRDWLLCAVLSDGSFKKRGLPQPSRHPFSPALLCQAHRMRRCRRTDGQTVVGRWRRDEEH